MAYQWIGRDDDDRYPLWTTLTDDEDDSPETSSFVNKQPFVTPTIDLQELTAIPTEILSLINYYSSKMSDVPGDRGPGGPSFDGHLSRPTGRPSRPSSDFFTDHSSHQISTILSTKTAYGDQDSWPSSTITTTPTLVPTGDASSPTSTDNDSPGLQNHGADKGSNRTAMYVAAGITPVVVVILGFLVFCCLRKRRRQGRAAAELEHTEEMKMQSKRVVLPYIAPISPPSPPPAVLPHYSPSSPSSSHPPTASSSQPIILGPIPSGNNGAYLTGMDTSDMMSMTSASNISRTGTIVDRDPFADGRSLEEAPPPYRPSSLPPASLASTSRNSSVRIAAPPQMTSRTHLIERSPFDDPEDDEVSELSGPTLGRGTDAMSDISDLSYQVDPVVSRSPF